MNLRALLRYELWSKEKSRKILSPVGRFLKSAAIVSAILAALLWGLDEVGSHWITPGERKAGRAALAQIEALAKIQLHAGEGFNEGDAKAKALIDIARKDTWTIRDHQTVKILSTFLWTVETNHDFDLQRSQIEAISRVRHGAERAGCNEKQATGARESSMNEYAVWRSAAASVLN